MSILYVTLKGTDCQGDFDCDAGRFWLIGWVIDDLPPLDKERKRLALHWLSADSWLFRAFCFSFDSWSLFLLSQLGRLVSITECGRANPASPCLSSGLQSVNCSTAPYKQYYTEILKYRSTCFALSHSVPRLSIVSTIREKYRNTACA